MILSDADIRRRLEEGRLAVEPLDDPGLQIQPASIDLRLGREFLEFQRTNIACIHPNSEQEVEEYVDETYVDEGEEFILHPGDFVLGTTLERVEIPPDLIAHVQGRSSMGRLAVVIHASLPYDEEVFLWTPEEGYGFYAIGEIVEHERSARAVSFDPTTLRVRTHRVTDYITNPTKRIYRVTLESGREVHVTRDHNLFTLDDYGGVTRIPSEDAEGTRVMVPGELPSPSGSAPTLEPHSLLDPAETTVYAADGLGDVDRSRPADPGRSDRGRESAHARARSCHGAADDATVASKQTDSALPRTIEVSPEFGWVLGVYLAAGSIHNERIQITTDEASLDRVAAWFDQYDTSLSWGDGEGTTTLTVCSTRWAELFQELTGPNGEATIPAQAWNWPDTVLEALLDGLLAANGRRRARRSTLYTTIGDLAGRVMYLADRLGLLGSMDRRDRGTDTESRDGFDHETEWTITVSEAGHERDQYVPVPTELLRTLRDRAGLDLGAAAEAMGDVSKSAITNLEQGHDDGVTRATLRQFREAYAEHGADTTRLDQLLDGDVRFERVESVERTDRVEPTYDLEVQPNGRAIENFLGGRGGVFLSNTAGVIDPGYRGQITLELSNLGTAPVALTPDMRISQIILTELSSPAERPYGSERGSKYQDQAGPQASRIQSDDEFGGDQP